MLKAAMIIVLICFTYIWIWVAQNGSFSTVIVHFDSSEIRYGKIPQIGRVKLRTFLFIRNTTSNIAGCTIVSKKNAFDFQKKGCVVIEITRPLAGKSIRTDLNYMKHDVLTFDLVREAVTPAYITKLLELVSVKAKKAVKAALSLLMLDVNLTKYEVNQQLSKILDIRDGLVLVHSRTVPVSSLLSDPNSSIISLTKESEGRLLAKGRDIQVRVTEEAHFKSLRDQFL